MARTIEANGTPNAIAPVSNGAEEIISYTEPYTAQVRVRGVAPFLFHRYNIESVAEKAAAAKGSKAKKSDDTESYVYRNDVGEICIPGRYFTAALMGAGRYIQDPRSPRKSAMDLLKAGVIPITELCSLGSKDWDYLDRQPVQIQRNRVPRERPAFRRGWTVEVSLAVLVPEYVSQDLLLRALTQAGKLVGVGDFRPTYGRFAITHFDISVGVPDD